VDCLHGLFQIDGRNSDEPLGKLADKPGNGIIRDDPCARPMPGAEQHAIHTNLIHQLDEVSRAQVLVEHMR
jgi:hypothetical protein